MTIFFLNWQRTANSGSCVFVFCDRAVEKSLSFIRSTETKTAWVSNLLCKSPDPFSHV